MWWVAIGSLRRGMWGTYPARESGNLNDLTGQGRFPLAPLVGGGRTRHCAVHADFQPALRQPGVDLVGAGLHLGRRATPSPCSSPEAGSSTETGSAGRTRLASRNSFAGPPGPLSL